MLFQADITIPANTSSTSPTEEILEISRGYITRFMVRPRPGHASLAHLVIRYHERIIAPSTEGMSLHGDADPIDWDDFQEVQERPFELKLEGWNDDDTYSHTFTVYVVVLQRQEIMRFSIIEAISGLFRTIFPRMISPGGR